MRCPDCAALMDGARLSPLVERWNQGFLQVGQSARSPEFSLRVFPVYRVHEKPLSAVATRLLLFIKFGSSVDHKEYISVDKFLFGVHIIWIFLLRVHIPPRNSLLSWLLTLCYSQPPFAFLTTSFRFLHLTPSYFCFLNMSSPKLWRGAEFVIPKCVSLA